MGWYASSTSKREYHDNLFEESFEARSFLAKDSGTCKAALDVLSHDHSWWVRDYVAENLSTTVYTLEYLSHDIDFRVRDSVERNPVWKKYHKEKERKPGLDERMAGAKGKVSKKETGKETEIRR